ncbi:hypothetical protein [Exiguobacterium mexicanum]|uniref:hypothetical protein n=1 Tax=Exiguobacterium mexicanum TaxID=340146 RepID=UPI00110F5657|nr:hypothetical protein [Exiguobacterium mexicanum]
METKVTNSVSIDAKESKRNLDTNASASAFGWEFQTNAAIYLAFQHIKSFTELKVEGEIDDIEVYFKDKPPIIAQVKSQENPEPNTNTLKSLRGGFKTLINATNKTNYSELIYISNINNPLSDKKVAIYFGKLSKFSYTELPKTASEIIDKHFDSVVKKEKLVIDKFRKDKFSLLTIPYFGADLPTRYRIMIETINRFLEKNNIRSYIGEDILHFLQKEFFTNSTIKHVNLKKEDIVWPIIVLGSLNLTDNLLEDFDQGCANEIQEKYNEYINKQTHKFGLITKVMSEFNTYRLENTTLGQSLKKIIPQFIESKWTIFIEEINCENKEVEEYLIKIIINLIIYDRFKIEKIKEATNL